MPQQMTKMIEQTGDLELERFRVKARLEIGEKDELIPQYLQELRDALKGNKTWSSSIGVIRICNCLF